MISLLLAGIPVTMPIPQVGDQVQFELENHISLGSKTCVNTYRLDLSVQAENGKTIVTTDASLSAGAESCAKIKNVKIQWIYADQTLIQMNECKADGSCTVREPKASDIWVDPRLHCDFLGNAIFAESIEVAKYGCGNLVGQASGKPALPSEEYWMNESIYPAYPFLNLIRRYEAPEYQYYSESFQKMISVKSSH